MLAPLPKYIDAILSDIVSIPDDRRPVLRETAAFIRGQLDRNEQAALNFICTHNSRRSQFGQVWAEVAAAYYDVPKVACFSGGVETTACDVRTVEALRRAGCSVIQETEAPNPRYRVRYSEEHPAIVLFSKIYNEQEHAPGAYAAMMCCADVDQRCPIVEGADARFALHYQDPKAADGTLEESAIYDLRCRQIAAEMFYTMSLVTEV